MLKKLIVFMFVLIALTMPAMAAMTLPISTTDPSATAIDNDIISNVTSDEVDEDLMGSENESVVIEPVIEIATPTPIPTLESMRNARELSNGMMYPNYKTAAILVDTGDGMGALYIQLSCHHNLISKEFTLQKVDNSDNVAFTNGNVVTPEFIKLFKTEGNATTYMLDHTGGWDSRITPGLYAVTLLDGNGGQPEYALIQVNEKYRSDVVFIGHGVSMPEEKKEEPVPIDECKSVIVNSVFHWSWGEWQHFDLTFNNLNADESRVTATSVETYTTTVCDRYWHGYCIKSHTVTHTNVNDETYTVPSGMSVDKLYLFQYSGATPVVTSTTSCDPPEDPPQCGGYGHHCPM